MWGRASFDDVALTDVQRCQPPGAEDDEATGQPRCMEFGTSTFEVQYK
jgi:hypothetical protein